MGGGFADAARASICASSVAAPVAQTSARPCPRDHARAGVEHRAALGERRVRSDRLELLGDRERLAGQGRLVELEPGCLDHARVCRDTLALRDEQEVARHDLLRADLADPAADDDRRLRERLGQSENRSLGNGSLPESEHGIHDEHCRDRDRLDRVADRNRHGRRTDEQRDERIEELVDGESHVRRPPHASRPIRAEADESLGGIGRVEPALRIGLQRSR